MAFDWRYRKSHPSAIVFDEKWFSWTGWDTDIKDEYGNIVFKVRGVFFSLRERLLLKDPAGIPILTLQEKMMTLHQRWRVYRGESTEDGDLLFSLKRTQMLQLKTTLEVFMAANTGKNFCDYKVKRSFFQQSCTIYKGNSDQILAVMEKDKVSISPNVDQAFVISLIMVLKAINNAFMTAALNLAGIPIS